MTTQIHALDLTVYVLTGHYDYTANRDLAWGFFDQISAPGMGFHTFRDSAHSTLFEEPQRARDILLQDVALRENRLADGQPVE